MGSLFAWAIARGGAELWAYDVWQDHVDVINRDGLAIRQGSSVHTARIQAVSDARRAPPCDAVMVFAKFNQTRAALEGARPMIAPNTIIVTLQNGIGNVELIASMFPDHTVVFGLTTLTSELLGPGRIEASYIGRGETYLWASDGDLRKVESLCDVLMKGGINAHPTPNIELKIWQKLIVNCCLNPVCAIAGASVGAVTDVPESWPLIEAVADEIVAAAQAEKIPLNRADAHAFLRAVAEEARNHEPSMLIDVRNRRTTEIECLNGEVVRICERHGLPAPYNRSLYLMIRTIEQASAKRHS